MTCKHCGKQLYVGDFDMHGFHDECAREIANLWPMEGETCNICEGNIMFMAAIDYEQYYICDGCRYQWVYD